MPKNNIKQLSKLKQISKSAVSQFTVAEEQLRISNEELDKIDEELYAEISRLTDAREEAQKQKEQNQMTINGIQAVIQGNI